MGVMEGVMEGDVCRFWAGNRRVGGSKHRGSERWGVGAPDTEGVDLFVARPLVVSSFVSGGLFLHLFGYRRAVAEV